MRWSGLSAALVLCLMPVSLALQTPEEVMQPEESDPWTAWRVTHYSTRQGLPQNWVTALAQTHDGFLWVGTQGGLARFDGTSFRVFDMASTPELRGNRIRALFEDSNRDLWIGTTSGGLLRLRAGRFTSFMDTPGVPRWRVQSISEDLSGTLWFAGSKLTRYRDGTFESVSIDDLGPDEVSVRRLHRDSQGGLWAVTSAGVARLSGEDWVLLEGPSGLGAPHFVGESPRGTWAKGRDWFAYIEDDALVPVPVSGQLPSKLSCSLIDRRGKTWVGAGRGLFSLHEGSPEEPADEVEFVPARLKRSVTGTFFGALLEDQEGNLWVGLDELIRLQPRPFASVPLPTSTRMKWAALVHEQGLDSVWAAAPGLQHHVEGEWESVEVGRAWGGISALIPARDGGFWSASDGSRLTLTLDGRFTDYPHDLGQVLCLHEDSRGVVWLMTRRELTSFEEGTFTPHPLDAAPSLPAGSPVVMGSTRAGALWIGWKGVAAVRDPAGEMRFYTPADGLPRAELRGIHEAQDGAIWISTYGTGLTRWSDGKFATITTRDGLPDNSLGAILEDENGQLWINSNRGVFTVSLDALNQVADGIAEQAPGRMITHTEGDGTEGGETADGHFWFRSMVSIDVIDPAAVGVPGAPPRLMLERVVADGETLTPGSAARVPPGAGTLEFNFAVVSLDDPGHVQVRYRLEGHEDDWTEAPTARAARYTNVPPGEYRFVLSASNSGGSWADSVLELDLELEPHFWQTPWFAGLAALLLTGAVVTIHRARTRAIRARNARLQSEIDRRLLVEVVREEQEERLQMALYSAEMGTWRWDPGLNRSTLDSSMCRMFGMGTEDITLQTGDLLTKVHPEDLPAARAEFLEAIAKRADFVREFRIVLPDGAIRWHRDRGRPHFSDDGELLYVTGASTDITERKRAEEQREELEENLRHRHKMEAIGQLASGVAHEFNNLLVGILCNTDLLLEATESSLDEVSRKRIRDIDHCGERAAALTHKLLSFAKRETSQDSLFCVNDVVLDAETMLRGLLGERIELTLELELELPAVLCDRAHMEQGLLNLVLNARDALDGDGRVTIQTATVTIDAEAVERNPEAHEGVHARFSVADSGCGMSEQTRERIFEPFFSTKPTGEGTGLGLSTLFADISNAGGHITVKTREGEGSTVSVFLPLRQPAGALPSLDTRRPAGSPTPPMETILVCDDEQVVLSSVASVLAHEGYEVLEAWGAEDARALAEEHEGPIHLLLVDVVMPESNGPELARELLLERPNMEVMFMSGYPAEVLRVEGREFEFLKKPPSRKTLLRRVDDVLAKMRAAAGGAGSQAGERDSVV